MPDADMGASFSAVVGAGFGTAGQTCMTLNIVVSVGSSILWYSDSFVYHNLILLEFFFSMEFIINEQLVFKIRCPLDTVLPIIVVSSLLRFGHDLLVLVSTCSFAMKNSKLLFYLFYLLFLFICHSCYFLKFIYFIFEFKILERSCFL